MTDGLRKAALAAVLALGVAACGGSSHKSSTTSAAPASAPAAQTSTSSTSGTTTPSAKRTPKGRTTSTPGALATAPPTSRATSGAPDGLRPASGYATYELCASQCSGAVPDSLRRPLHLPAVSAGAPCPVSGSNGPVAPLGSAQLAIKPFAGSAWAGGRVTWVASSSYEGPILIRGRQLGGSGAVGFGEGHVPYDELQLLAPGQGAATPRGTGREWFTVTRVKGPGCYAYQVDGTSLSEVIVFRAVG